MATSVAFGGPGGSAFTQYNLTSGPVALPGGGRAMANGSTACGLRLTSVLVGGNGANRSGVAILAGSSGTFSAPSGAPAYQNVPGSLVLVNGGSDWLYINPVGSIRIGRAGGGATSDGRDVNFSGTIGGTYEWSQAPTAPGLTSVAMAGPTSAIVTFTAPSDDGGEPLTGYRIVYANNPAFSGATTLDVGADALTRTITGLTPGQWWFKVAARNAVTGSAGSSSTFSSSQSVVLTSEVGDLDGWAAHGTLPTGLTPLVGAGLRRGSVYPLGAGAPLGLLREIQCTGSGSTAAGLLGISRTFTGLVVGRTYRLAGTALSLQDTTPTGNLYRWKVDGVGTGSNATTTDTTHPVAIPSYTFVATATSHVVRIELNEATSWSGEGWFEAVAFYGLTLTEIPNTSPYRLQDVALESSLSNHFTIACDTVGAAWWVDSDDVAQFRQVADDGAIRAIFTDLRAAGELEYIDVAVAYDTRNVVNTLRATNHGRDPLTGNTRDADYELTDAASVALWGPRAGAVAMCLRSGYVDVTNLLVNPTAGLATTGWAAGILGTGGTLSRVATAIPGTRASSFFRASMTAAQVGGLFNNGGQAASTTTVAVVAGTQYTASAWVRSSVAKTVYLAVELVNAAGTNLGSQVGPDVALTANTWTRLSFTFTAPANAARAGLYSYARSNWANGHTYDLGGALLTAGSTLHDYFDGASTPSIDFIYGWTGPEHASTATRTTWELLNDRLAEIVDQLDTPDVVVSSITWNAQELPAIAAALDVQDRVRVRFRGRTRDYRIVGMRHRITATQWLITFTFTPSGAA